MPPVPRRAPTTSIRPGCRAGSATNLGARTTIAISNGTLMNITQRQESSAVSTPPRMYPIDTPAPAPAENAPSARLRAGKATMISDSVPGGGKRGTHALSGPRRQARSGRGGEPARDAVRVGTSVRRRARTGCSTTPIPGSR
ncbi:hypothetical protein FAGKG844_100136 [Frankia sp. AgKG'84/4]